MECIWGRSSSCSEWERLCCAILCAIPVWHSAVYRPIEAQHESKVSSWFLISFLYLTRLVPSSSYWWVQFFTIIYLLKAFSTVFFDIWCGAIYDVCWGRYCPTIVAWNHSCPSSWLVINWSTIRTEYLFCFFPYVLSCTSPLWISATTPLFPMPTILFPLYFCCDCSLLCFLSFIFCPMLDPCSC